MPTRTAGTGGNWPIADVMLISDYSSPDQATHKVTAGINDCIDRLRIHMDVPYDSNDDIRGMIEDGNLIGIYNAICAYKPNANNSGPRAAAVLAAALGLFDGKAPPYPVPVPAAQLKAVSLRAKGSHKR